MQNLQKVPWVLHQLFTRMPHVSMTFLRFSHSYRANPCQHIISPSQNQSVFLFRDDRKDSILHPLSPSSKRPNIPFISQATSPAFLLPPKSEWTPNQSKPTSPNPSNQTNHTKPNLTKTKPRQTSPKPNQIKLKETPQTKPNPPQDLLFLVDVSEICRGESEWLEELKRPQKARRQLERWFAKFNCFLVFAL